MGKILATQYATKPSNTREADIVCIAKELSSWKDSLPAEIVYTELLEEKMGKEFWANMLQIAYKFVSTFSILLPKTRTSH